ncbi:xanthine dehydrogenase family protein subunit M [Reyranella aquatilis]|jgi:carbon-monoxide dehydrogenase medium subunit|uniref:Xanthine dehydrogenase family protein subunit M n=1 Tax=Reyranella aquatilis TaxID=2035356 RepID=A0ABS8KMW7_9HYPH|nr:xanthine dehydrogenase family protein subunit M [Reyranella aquatilis]MCC8427421.1 xanthine dehydrogenase family protein subunit M [Reyranella aquatilis]
MYDFAYHRPKSVADAVALLKGKEEARPMSGGMTLIPTLKQRLAKPSDVVDLGGVKELAGIKVEGGNVVIGAMTKHGDVATSADVKAHIPALADLAGHIGDPQVRNRGTIGGSVANADPAADYPAAVVALNATVTTNTGKHAADGFFKGLFETALGEGEIITSISFPKPEKAAYMKFPNPASRYAMVGVFVAKTASGVRVAVTGAGPSVFRVKAMEEALSKNFSSDAIKDIKVPATDLNSDIHGSAEYRAHLVGVMARRAVDKANK